MQQTGEQLQQLPRWAYRRRRTLNDALASGLQQLQQTEPTSATLDADIDRLTRQIDHHTRQRQASDLAAQRPIRPNAWDRTRTGQPAGSGLAPLDAHELASMLARREPYRGPERDHTDGLRR